MRTPAWVASISEGLLHMTYTHGGKECLVTEADCRAAILVGSRVQQILLIPVSATQNEYLVIKQGQAASEGEIMVIHDSVLKFGHQVDLIAPR